MHRIDGPGAVNGLFTAGDPAVPQMATVVTPEWLNDVQENIANVILDAGIALEKGSYDQLRQAIALATAPAGTPHAVLDFPTVCTPDNRAGVTGQAGTTGGKVSLPAGVPMTLGRDLGNSMGYMMTFTTAAWQSADLLANATYFVRAQVTADGALLLYVQQGADVDAVPASRKGTPNAAAGGGFDSTQVDVLLAKVATGAAGAVPVVTNLANARRLRVSSYSEDAFTRVSRSTGQLGLARVTPLLLNWARTPLTKIVSCDYQFNGSATSPEGVMTYYSGTYPDGTSTLYADVSRYKFHPIFMVDTNTASTSYNVALATDYYVEA